MMSLDQIHRVSAEAAIRAARKNLVPLVLYPDDDIPEMIRSIPFIGDYLPPGWERVRLTEREYFHSRVPHGVYSGDNDGYGAFFVDASGFGAPGEPAMTFGEFLKHVRANGLYGYAIVEEGQFQVKIGVFRKRRPVT